MNVNNSLSPWDRLIWVLITFLFSAFLLFDLNIWISYIILVTSIAVFLLYVLKNRGVLKLSFDRYHAHVLLFAVFCIASSLWARNSSDAITKGTTIIEILICMSLIYMYYQTQPNVRGLILCFIISAEP